MTFLLILGVLLLEINLRFNEEAMSCNFCVLKEFMLLTWKKESIVESIVYIFKWMSDYVTRISLVDMFTITSD